MSLSSRAQALRVLCRTLDNHTPLSHLTTGLDPFARALCFGVCRHFYRLDAVAKSLARKWPAKTPVRMSVLMGLYELLYLGTPEHAVVQETVNLLDARPLQFARGFVNAMLRRACREKAMLGRMVQDAPGFPAWFQSAVQTDWPTDALDILAASDAHPPMTLRVNRKHVSVQDYLQRLEASGIIGSPTRFSADGIVLSEPCDVDALPGFVDGVVSVQDEAAQLASMLLDLAPGLRVLDACCAPGGKLCHMLERVDGPLELIGLDADEGRLARVRENTARLGLPARLLKGDARFPETWWDGIPFDRILVDAPCSATGVMRRQPDIRILRTPEEVTGAAALQKDILEALWPLLSPGGLLVYATCSVLAVENEHQIAGFVSRGNDRDAVGIPCAFGRPTGYGVQILPGEHGMDGFFYSILRKGTLHVG